MKKKPFINTRWLFPELEVDHLGLDILFYLLVGLFGFMFLFFAFSLLNNAFGLLIIGESL